jgi:hypothetical protein
VAELGIRTFRSQRLVLYTDLPAELAEELPPLVDALWHAWEAYFGPLPPARDGSEFQVTGYLMRDQAPFLAAGMLPARLPRFAHGRIDQQQFWINDDQSPYYRRHLLLHEATHCYMQAMGGTTIDVPVWYLEGMAELFGTHVRDPSGPWRFGVFPVLPEDHPGLGRIELIGQELEGGRRVTAAGLGDYTPRDFTRRNEPYAWSWAACQLAYSHPRYREAFQQLAREYPVVGFNTLNERLLGPLAADFALEWELFVRSLCYGYDVARAAIEFQPGEGFQDPGEVRTMNLRADRGWQPSGVRLKSGQTCLVEVRGRVTLATEPRPWESEPEGISIRYAGGRPIGQVLGLLIGEPDGGSSGRSYGTITSLGRSGRMTAPLDGTLYLRVNDFWSDLANNSGQFEVTIAPIANP